MFHHHTRSWKYRNIRDHHSLGNRAVRSRLVLHCGGINIQATVAVPNKDGNLADPVLQILQYIMEVADVMKRYGDEVTGTVALHGTSFSISQGDFVSIVGPSGSGKSTLLNIIGALDRPTAGKVFIADNDLSQMSNDDLAKVRNEELGFVFQSFNLIPRMTAAENIALPLLIQGMGPGERRQRAFELLEEFGLESKSENKPGELSGGEQQRVAVARALANNPSIILADEPTGNLDTKNSELMLEIFQRLNSESEKTLIIITHNPELARKAKKMISIRDGRIEEIKEN
jgi:putative ABC transport system ATP-binding protein